MSLLHEKTGSDSPLKQFTYLLQRVIAKNSLPDYVMSLTKVADGSPAVHFVRRDIGVRTDIREDLKRLERLNAEDRRSLELDGLER